MGHVLMLTTSYPTQVTSSGFPRGTFVEDFARLLIDQGHSVSLLTHGGESVVSNRNDVTIHQFKVSKSFIALSENGIPEIRRNFGGGFSLLRYFTKFLFETLRLLRSGNYTHIWAHWLIPLGILAGISSKIFGMSYSVTCYGAELLPLEKSRSKFLKRGARFFCVKATQVMCISQSTMHRLKSCIGFSGEMIPDPIDINRYKIQTSDYRSQHGIHQDSFLIGFSGRMVERKGHAILIEAGNILLSKGNQQIIFVIGGDGPLKSDLEGLASKHPRQFLFPGFVETTSMTNFLNALDLFVLPSIVDSRGDGEGSATAALEAMSCGTPVLISHSAGNIGSIIEDQGGWYFIEASPKDLADRIELVLLQKVELSRQSQKARNFVVEHYSWNAIAGKVKVGE